MNTSLANGWINDALTISPWNFSLLFLMSHRLSRWHSNVYTFYSSEHREREHSIHVDVDDFIVVVAIAVKQIRFLLHKLKLEKPRTTSRFRNLSYIGWKDKINFMSYFCLFFFVAFVLRGHFSSAKKIWIHFIYFFESWICFILSTRKHQIVSKIEQKCLFMKIW